MGLCVTEHHNEFVILPSLICHFEISFSFNSRPLSEKRLGDGCLKHGVACHTKNEWHPCCQSELCRHVSTASLQFFNEKEAAVERCERSPDIKQESNQVLEGVCFCTHGLLQTKPAEIDGFETRLACFPLIISSHLHLSLSLLIPWLCFELRAASSDSS